jgi:Mlc titration factor MtfA (ptsG expression regulator)
MVFSWLRKRRRRKLLAEPFPIRWLPYLERNVGHYPLLSPAEQAKLRDIARVLIAEKTWQGGRGLYVTEEMKVTIAAQAALLLLGRDHDFYSRVATIIVYPDCFRTPRQEDDWEDDELSDVASSGMAVYRGPVLVAWEDVMAEGPDPDCGHNIVVHEFAHQLDYLDNAINGTPDLGSRELEARWRYVMTVAFEDHRRAIAKGSRETFFTEYAAENETEFFADASEAFFCRPIDMREDYPEVYELLAAYYRVDPVKWFEGPP